MFRFLMLDKSFQSHTNCHVCQQKYLFSFASSFISSIASLKLLPFGKESEGLKIWSLAFSPPGYITAFLPGDNTSQTILSISAMLVTSDPAIK